MTAKFGYLTPTDEACGPCWLRAQRILRRSTQNAQFSSGASEDMAISPHQNPQHEEIGECCVNCGIQLLSAENRHCLSSESEHFIRVIKLWTYPRNISYRLPQLAVSAKILCLLMVVICGAVPSMVRSVRLYSQCSHMYVNVFPNGTVMARSDGNDQPNLTISTRGVSLELLIHSPMQDMYLCFNRSRLVGRRLTRFQAERQPNCLFKEEFVDGYNRYHLVKNEDRYIGFNRRGLQLRRGKSRLTERLHKCFSFMIEAHDFDINRHNIVRAGDQPKWRPQRRLRPSLNAIKQPCHGTRHHHGRPQRRRNCDGT